MHIQRIFSGTNLIRDIEPIVEFTSVVEENHKRKSIFRRRFARYSESDEIATDGGIPIYIDLRRKCAGIGCLSAVGEIFRAGKSAESRTHCLYAVEILHIVYREPVSGCKLPLVRLKQK